MRHEWVQVMHFFLPMEKPPTITHQEKKVRCVRNKPIIYEPQELKDARAKFESALAPHRPTKPLEGGVRLTTKWGWSCGTKHYDGEYKITKPDVTNMIKLFEDVMEDLGFFKDDAQVCSGHNEKFWAKIPGIYVDIQQLDSGPRKVKRSRRVAV